MQFVQHSAAKQGPHLQIAQHIAAPSAVTAQQMTPAMAAWPVAVQPTLRPVDMPPWPWPGPECHSAQTEMATFGALAAVAGTSYVIQPMMAGTASARMMGPASVAPASAHWTDGIPRMKHPDAFSAEQVGQVYVYLRPVLVGLSS